MRRCSYCYKTGHNRRTCSKLKEYISDNPASYAAQAAKRVAKRRSTTRRCSYCCETGHTKRTCADRSADLVGCIKKNRRFRRKLRNALARKGFTPGALVKFVPLVSPEQVSAAPRDPRGVQHAFNVFRERQGDHVTAMIVGYRFGNLNFDYFDSRETQAAVALVTPSGRSFTMPLPVEIEESIRGTLPTTADQGWVSQYNLWTFLRCEVAAKSPIVSPRHHLSKIWTEEFQSGEMNAADMVNRHADGDGHRRGVFRD